MFLSYWIQINKWAQDSWGRTRLALPCLSTTGEGPAGREGNPSLSEWEFPPTLHCFTQDALTLAHTQESGQKEGVRHPDLRSPGVKHCWFSLRNHHVSKNPRSMRQHPVHRCLSHYNAAGPPGPVCFQPKSAFGAKIVKPEDRDGEEWEVSSA